MASELSGTRVAFLTANEGVEQAELTAPWEAVKDAGGTPELIAPQAGEGQGFDHVDKAEAGRPAGVLRAAGQGVPASGRLAGPPGRSFPSPGHLGSRPGLGAVLGQKVVPGWSCMRIHGGISSCGTSRACTRWPGTPG